MTNADNQFVDETNDQPVAQTEDQSTPETTVFDASSEEDDSSCQDATVVPEEESIAPDERSSSVTEEASYEEPVPEDDQAAPEPEATDTTETEVPEDVESTPDEVSLEDVEVSADIPFSDSERLAYKLLKRASQLKGVTIPRAAFLSGELSKLCEAELVDAAAASTPHEANVPLDIVDTLADEAIGFEAGKVAGISALAGVPGGLIGLGTIPADIMQFVAHSLRMAQELAYLYGWPSFADESGAMDDDALYELILLLGSAMQVEGTALTLAQVADDISQAGAQESLRQLLGEDEWYLPIKKVLSAMGTAATQGTFVEVVSRGIPLLSGLITGSLTYATFRPAATALKQLLRALPQATGDVMPEDQMVELIAQIEEETKVALDVSLRSALESAGEKAGTFVSQMGDAADDFTDRFGEAAVAVAQQAGAAANVVADKAAEYAVAARDKAVDAAKAAAIGFIKGIGTSKRDKRRKKGQDEAPEVVPTPEAANTAASTSDYTQELRLLKALLDDGIITQEEFDAKKRQLLGL